MKNIIKYVSILLLLLVSFYYTDKVSSFLINRSKLMNKLKTINAKNIDPVNAIMDEEYIIPGLNGQSINYLDSYYAMQSTGVFSEKSIKYDINKPNISLNNNKDKIIKNGNPIKNAITLIIEHNEKIYKYVVQNNLNIDIAISQKEYMNQSLEIINNDKNNFLSFHNMLLKNHQNTNICLVNSMDKKACIQKGYYLVEPTYYFTNESIISYNPSAGDIILLDDSLSLDIFKWLIKTINYRNYQIVNLTQMISEAS